MYRDPQIGQWRLVENPGLSYFIKYVVAVNPDVHLSSVHQLPRCVDGTWVFCCWCNAGIHFSSACKLVYFVGKALTFILYRSLGFVIQDTAIVAEDYEFDSG